MKKELNSALLHCVDEILPVTMVHYKCKSKTRSRIVFCNTDNEGSKLWLFVIVSPDSKTDSINIHLGWSSDGKVPENFINDVRSLDIRGLEVQLQEHCMLLPRLYSNTIKSYKVLPIPDTLEELAESIEKIDSERALLLVRSTLVKVRIDLKEYAIPYFDWVVEMKK